MKKINQYKLSTESVFLEHDVLAGNHCESSAILNALNYQGWKINENQLIGAGTAPDFVYEKTRFPFLGGRSLDFRETLSCSLPLSLKVRPSPGCPEWGRIRELLVNGHPVVLRADMRFLPYLYGGKYGPRHMSFGWHLVTIFALDLKKNAAFVSDTSSVELQRISLRDLEKARLSRTRVFPPEGEYYWFEGNGDDAVIDWTEIALSSLRKYSASMKEGMAGEKVLTGLGGLKELSGEIRSFPRTLSPWMIIPLLEFHYGCIETNGTGGAAFRTMFREFLEENLCGEKYLHIRSDAGKSEMAWHCLADSYMRAAELYKKADKNRRLALLEEIAHKAEQLYEAERKLIENIDNMMEYNGE